MIGVLISGAVSVVVVLVTTPLLMRWFRQRGVGQYVRDGANDPQHQEKVGTPTMGGMAFVAAGVVGFVAGHLADINFSPSGVLMLFVFLGMATVGWFDDVIKLRRRRSLGLGKTEKFLAQAAIAGIVAWAGPTWAGWPREISLVGEMAVGVPWWLWVGWVFLLISGFSNEVGS